jgi:hypothetical protein
MYVNYEHTKNSPKESAIITLKSNLVRLAQIILARKRK